VNRASHDVAKILLESAKDDRLDFRLEAAELQQSPTESLSAIWRKWEQKQDLSRAEWILLSQYIAVVCEELTENPDLPTADSFATLLDALLAVAVDVLERPRCSGPMRILAAIHPPESIRKILDCLGLPSRAPPIARAVPEDADEPDI
jgi:hypothetical protein